MASADLNLTIRVDPACSQLGSVLQSACDLSAAVRSPKLIQDHEHRRTDPTCWLCEVYRCNAAMEEEIARLADIPSIDAAGFLSLTP